MTDKDYLESNELISDFMGLRSGEWYHICPSHGRGICHAKLMEYHHNWNWVMAVCKKIQCIVKSSFDRDSPTVPKGVTWTTQEYDKSYGVFVYAGRIDIEKTYTAIVYFIKWYNSNQLNNEL